MHAWPDPPACFQDLLVKIAKKLKKNSVAVDVISFGCEAENEEKLEAFHAAVNSNGNSNLVTVPPGPVLSDVLISSPIFQGEGGGGYGFQGSGAGGGGAEGFEFGVDPNMDPDLALALRVSLEEERARQNAAAAAAGSSGAAGSADAAGAGGATPAAPAAAAAGGAAGDMDLDEDALLQQALAMSMQVDQEAAAATPAAASAPAATPAAPAPADNDAAMFNVEDEELARALALSMQDAGPEDEVRLIEDGVGLWVLALILSDLECRGRRGAAVLSQPESHVALLFAHWPHMQAKDEKK
jgi:26S proteasome regulatory subunit N10